MRCSDVQDQLSSFYDCECDSETRRCICQHMENCPSCQAALEEFKSVSKLVRAITPGLAPDWNQIQSALVLRTASDHSPAQASDSALTPHSQSTATVVSPVPANLVGDDRLQSDDPVLLPRPAWKKYLPYIAAFAACLLLAVAYRGFVQPGNPQLNSQAYLIDYESLADAFHHSPQTAVDEFLAKFSAGGQSVAAKQTIDFPLLIASRLPGDNALVETHAVHLPQCHCRAGQCVCGPGGCNCAVCVCQRNDGSRYLIFEHCPTQPTRLGNGQQFVTSGSSEVQILDRGDQIAGTWQSQGRRLTAIGLRNRSELDQMVALSLAQSTGR